jgi:type 2 lantibiotic biosynthesis protein LanM
MDATHPFAKAVYPWERAEFFDSDAELAEAYLKESRIADLPYRAKQVGLSPDAFLMRIGAKAAFSREAQPEWLDWLLRAERENKSAGSAVQQFRLFASENAMQTLAEAELSLIRVFDLEIGLVIQELRQALEHLYGAPIAERLSNLCVDAVLKHVWRIAHPSLLLELKLASKRGELHASSAELRFAEFCQQLSGERREKLRQLYPLLWRDLAEFCMCFQRRRIELFADIASHAQELSDTLGAKISLQTLRLIEADVADLHNEGNATLLLHFQESRHAPQTRCAYKPRNLLIESRFLKLYRDVLQTLGHNVQIPQFVFGRAIERDFGFMEFVSHRCLSNDETRSEYAFRLGVLLAVADSVLGTDFHYENIIAVGSTPIPIDVETLFQPFMRAELGGELPGELMRLTGFRVGILPRTYADASTEFSPMFSNEGKSYPAVDLVDVGTDQMRLAQFARKRSILDKHLPRDSTGVQSLLGEQLSFENGWRMASDCLSARWTDLCAPGGAIEEMSHLPVRLIARATDHYQMIARAISAPRYLQCCAKRLALIDRLWQGFVPSYEEGERFQSEVETLARGEIPYFFGHPRSRSLRSKKRIFENVFTKSAWEDILLRGAQRTAAQFQRQLAAMRAAFSVSIEHDHRVRKLPIQPSPLRTIAAHRQGWQQVLGNVVHVLVNKQFHDEQQCGWLRLEASNQGLSIRFTGLDLYSGLTGIGLSLARLAASPYASEEVFGLVQQCFSSVAFRLQRNPRALMSIGWDGAGGVLYGASLARQLLPGIGEQTNFNDIENRCIDFLRSKRSQALESMEMDVIGGAAGALLGLCAAWHGAQNDRQADIQTEIGAWANLILQKICHIPSDLGAGCGRDQAAWPSQSFPVMMTGMAHGACGIVIALSEARKCLPSNDIEWSAVLAAALNFETRFIVSGQPIWRDARFGVVEGADECAMAWCHGAPGLLAARLRVTDSSLTEKTFSDQLEQVIQHGFEDDWVLCHGALGQLMILKKMQRAGRLDAERFFEMESSVLDAWERAWPELSNQAIQPGLFDGLAGAIFCALDMLDVETDLDLLACSTQLTLVSSNLKDHLAART